MRTPILLTTLMFSLNAFSYAQLDKKDELNGVELKSLKENSTRTYMGATEKFLPFPLEIVKASITSYDKRCNNAYKDKRKYTSGDYDCKYHNDHMVETLVVKDIRKTDALKEYSEYYLLGRQVYNRSAYGFYELVTIKEQKNKQNLRTVTITQKMLADKEVSFYTSPKFSRESAFDNSMAVFTLTELTKDSTSVTYEYKAETDHWLLNKEVAIPQVFASISKSINDLLSSVEAESLSQKRDLASKE